MSGSAISTGCLGGLPVENFVSNFDTSLTFAEQTEMTFSFCAAIPEGGEWVLDEQGIVIEADGNAITYTYGIVGAADAVPTYILTAVRHGTETCPSLAATSAKSEVEAILENNLIETTVQTSRNASRISNRAAARLRRNTGPTCGTQIAALLIERPIRFASDRFFIDASNNGVLDRISELLGTCSDAKFLIEGHTDSDASDAYNISLSQNRVDAVKASLVQRGIATDRLDAKGFGESRPIATNATEEGRALNRRVEFILIQDGALAAVDGCNPVSSSSGGLDGFANSSSANLNGQFNASRENCGTGQYRETWARVDITNDSNFGTNARLNFGLSNERQADGVLRGYFVEGYLSRSEVDTGTVDGSITGVGIHAGLFRARYLQSGLLLNYYGSAAAGKHEFSLTGSSNAEGDFTYLGLFAGAAISGERVMGAMTLRPRAGVDLAYAETTGVDFDIGEAIDIDPVSYSRVFAEVDFVQSVGTSEDTSFMLLTVTPRLFCEFLSDRIDESCGLGASMNFESQNANDGMSWIVGADFEAIGDTRRASLALTRSRTMTDLPGVASTSLGLSEAGGTTLAQNFRFNW